MHRDTVTRSSAYFPFVNFFFALTELIVEPDRFTRLSLHDLPCTPDCKKQVEIYLSDHPPRYFRYVKIRCSITSNEIFRVGHEFTWLGSSRRSIRRKSGDQSRQEFLPPMAIYIRRSQRRDRYFGPREGLSRYNIHKRSSIVRTIAGPIVFHAMARASEPEPYTIWRGRSRSRNRQRREENRALKDEQPGRRRSERPREFYTRKERIDISVYGRRNDKWPCREMRG